MCRLTTLFTMKLGVWLQCVSVLVIITCVTAYPPFLPLWVIVSNDDNFGNSWTPGAVQAFQFAEQQYNKDENNQFHLNISYSPFGSVRLNQTWDIQNLVCERLGEGFVLLLGEANKDSHPAFRSVAEGTHMPFINWGSPLVMPINGDAASRFEVSVRPPTAQIIADLIRFYNWTNIIYVHDGKNGAVNLQWINWHLHNPRNKSLPARTLSVQLFRLPRVQHNFQSFIDTFHRDRYNETQQFHIVLDASSSVRQRELLKAIHKSITQNQNFHYIVVNFDLEPQDVDMLADGVLNITGFQIVRRNQPAYWRFVRSYSDFLKRAKDQQHEDISVDEALVHDAVAVAADVLNRFQRRQPDIFQQNMRKQLFFNRHQRGIHCHAKHGADKQPRKFYTFEHGETIAKFLQNTSIGKLDSADETLTGHIEFDEYGRRKNFRARIIEILFTSRQAYGRIKEHEWHQSSGLLLNESREGHSRRGTTQDEDDIRIITTVMNKPFTILKRNANKSNLVGNDRYEGYCVDLMKLLAEKEGFRYNISIVKDGKWGAVSDDGKTWNGMIGELLRGEADMAVAPLTINQARERVVDFSKPFMTTGITIMIKKPDKQEFSVFSFMQPLSTEIWLYIIFAYVGVSVVIFLVSRFSPYEWRVEEMPNGGFTISNDFSVYNCLWFTLAAFMQQGTDILPRSVSGRIASSTWWFFTMIMVSSYTANLAAFLTLEKMQPPIKGVEELAKQTEIQYGIQDGGSTADFFKFSTVQMYKRMYHYMSTQVPPVFEDTYDDGIKRVRESKGRYAFLLEGTANEYANTRKPCDTMKVGDPINTVGYGVATPIGSKFKNRMNWAILDLQERGEIKKLENKWWYDRGQCEQGIADSQSSSLNLSKVAGIFYILIAGMVVAMVAALCEFVYRSRIEARNGKVTSAVADIAKGMLTRSLREKLATAADGDAKDPNDDGEQPPPPKLPSIGHSFPKQTPPLTMDEGGAFMGNAASMVPRKNTFDKELPKINVSDQLLVEPLNHQKDSRYDTVV